MRENWSQCFLVKSGRWFWSEGEWKPGSEENGSNVNEVAACCMGEMEENYG